MDELLTLPFFIPAAGAQALLPRGRRSLLPAGLVQPPSLLRAPALLIASQSPGSTPGGLALHPSWSLAWVPGLQSMTRSPGSFSFAGIRTPHSASSPAHCVQIYPALGLKPRKVLKCDGAPQEQWAHPRELWTQRARAHPIFGLRLTTPHPLLWLLTVHVRSEWAGQLSLLVCWSSWSHRPLYTSRPP